VSDVSSSQEVELLTVLSQGIPGPPGPPGLQRYRWDFATESGREAIESVEGGTWAFAIGHSSLSPYGATDRLIVTVPTGASPGPASGSRYVKVMFDPDLTGIDTPNGAVLDWSVGVGVQIVTGGATVPAAWPADIPGIFQRSTWADGSVTSGYLGTDYDDPNRPGQPWAPNFVTPQWNSYSSTLLWAGYPTVMRHYAPVTDDEIIFMYDDDGYVSGSLSLYVSNLWNQNAFNIHVYFLELTVLAPAEVM
jgi:hypothetical protein